MSGEGFRSAVDPFLSGKEDPPSQLASTSIKRRKPQDHQGLGEVEGQAVSSNSGSRAEQRPSSTPAADAQHQPSRAGSYHQGALGGGAPTKPVRFTQETVPDTALHGAHNGQQRISGAAGQQGDGDATGSGGRGREGAARGRAEAADGPGAAGQAEPDGAQAEPEGPADEAGGRRDMPCSTSFAAERSEDMADEVVLRMEYMSQRELKVMDRPLVADS
jgi:hypothetical protein